MKKHIILILLAGSIFPAKSQNSIQSILQQIEINNLQLKANEQVLTASKWNNKSENNLANPSLSYSKVWDTKDSKDTDMEMSITQAFDFPTAYVARSRAIKNRNKSLEAFYNAQRQDILLKAKEVCLEIIKLNQEKKIIEKRMHNAQGLLENYQMMINTGSATKLDFNKIKLDVLNQKTELTIVQANIKKQVALLQEFNANIPLDIDSLDQYTDETTLPDFKEVSNEALGNSYELLQTKFDYEASRKQITANKSEWLPGLELGYKRTAGPGRHSNGFVVGLSIPIFNNRGKVSAAKAESISKLYEQDLTLNKIQSTIYQAYEEAYSLINQINDYNGLIDIDDSFKTLETALDHGQITVTDYFVEMAIIYQSAQNYINLNYQFQKQLAQLYKHKL